MVYNWYKYKWVTTTYRTNKHRNPRCFFIGKIPQGFQLCPGVSVIQPGVYIMRGSYSRKPRGSKSPRADKDQANRSLFEHNRKIILATQSICGICGRPVDKSIKYPDPMSPTVDHIIPLNKNGDPVALDNLQLAHRYCNRMKSDKILSEKQKIVDENRRLPLTEDWARF